MDSFEFNKMAGALLGALVICMGLGFVSDVLFYHPAPAKPGYDLPRPAPTAAGGAQPAAPEQPLPVLLAKADPHKGEADAKACEACHNFEKGAAAKIGPPLYGVVGRQVASVPGFDYSDALKKKGGVWTLDKIFDWIKDPAAYAPGTKMAFAGEPDPQRRADIIDYLRTLSDTPEPLPPVPAAAKAPAAPAPAAPGSAGSNGAPTPKASGAKAPPAASDKAAPTTSSEAAPNAGAAQSAGQRAPAQASPAGTSSAHPAAGQTSTQSGAPSSDSTK